MSKSSGRTNATTLSELRDTLNKLNSNNLVSPENKQIMNLFTDNLIAQKIIELEGNLLVNDINIPNILFTNQQRVKALIELSEIKNRALFSIDSEIRKLKLQKHFAGLMETSNGTVKSKTSIYSKLGNKIKELEQLSTNTKIQLNVPELTETKNALKTQIGTFLSSNRRNTTGIQNAKTKLKTQITKLPKNNKNKITSSLKRLRINNSMNNELQKYINKEMKRLKIPEKLESNKEEPEVTSPETSPINPNTNPPINPNTYPPINPNTYPPINPNPLKRKTPNTPTTTP